jgi:hypothetical protein
MDIKNTSGFTWSDEYGAGIVIKNDDVWDRYVKVCTSVTTAAAGTTNNAITLSDALQQKRSRTRASNTYVLWSR